MHMQLLQLASATSPRATCANARPPFAISGSWRSLTKTEYSEYLLGVAVCSFFDAGPRSLINCEPAIDAYRRRAKRIAERAAERAMHELVPTSLTDTPAPPTIPAECLWLSPEKCGYDPSDRQAMRALVASALDNSAHVEGMYTRASEHQHADPAWNGLQCEVRRHSHDFTAMGVHLCPFAQLCDVQAWQLDIMLACRCSPYYRRVVSHDCLCHFAEANCSQRSASIAGNV